MNRTNDENTSTTIDIIYEDEDLIAINKPHGLLVHRTRIAADADIFALQLVRRYYGKRVYPAHRIDRKTSGILLFTKNQDANRTYQGYFREGQIEKEYHAIVRGWIDTSGKIDYPLLHDGKKQAAITHYEPLTQFELDLPFGKHETSRYSLVSIQPSTGRFHQIRKHMAHIFHPIIGDRPHGCNKQNRLWKEKFDLTTMLLHARKLIIPKERSPQIITAPYSAAFSRALILLETSSK